MTCNLCLCVAVGLRLCFCEDFSEISEVSFMHLDFCTSRLTDSRAVSSTLLPSSVSPPRPFLPAFLSSQIFRSFRLFRSSFMLGPRSRSAAQRAPRAEKVSHVAEQDSDDDDKERAPKQPKNPERDAGGSASLEAPDASNLYAIVNRNSQRHLFYEKSSSGQSKCGFYLAFAAFSISPYICTADRTCSLITVVTMTGAAIAIPDAAAADTILSVKQRVLVVNCKLPVHRQRLVYSAGPRGLEALADDETLDGAGVAQDGTAELDLMLADPTAEDLVKLGRKV